MYAQFTITHKSEVGLSTAAPAPCCCHNTAALSSALALALALTRPLAIAGTRSDVRSCVRSARRRGPALAGTRRHYSGVLLLPPSDRVRLLAPRPR